MLQGLTVSSGLTPEFEPKTFEYTSVINKTGSITNTQPMIRVTFPYPTTSGEAQLRQIIAELTTTNKRLQNSFDFKDGSQTPVQEEDADPSKTFAFFTMQGGNCRVGISNLATVLQALDEAVEWDSFASLRITITLKSRINDQYGRYNIMFT